MNKIHRTFVIQLDDPTYDPNGTFLDLSDSEPAPVLSVHDATRLSKGEVSFWLDVLANAMPHMYSYHPINMAEHGWEEGKTLREVFAEERDKHS